MKILVIDKLFQKRSGVAETDMYLAMQTEYDLSFNLSDIYLQNYDILWLGAYHYRLGLDINQILLINTKPVFVCQADNEEFAKEPYYKDVTIICRYLPNESLSNYNTKLLNWYINPKRIPESEKTCDVAFICSMYDDRLYYAKVIKEVCERNNYTYIIGEYHEDYYSLISKCRVIVIESGRKCLTLKYTEAILAKSIIVGTRPIYPENDIDMIECDLGSFENVENSIKFALNKKFKRQEIFTKEMLLESINNIING